jgi:hypothetical protein
MDAARHSYRRRHILVGFWKTHIVAEAASDKTQRREAELDGVLKQADARREATMKNLERLRALRIERDAKKKNQPVAKVKKRA